MVLKAGKFTAFFDHPNQIDMPHETRIQLQSEGVSSPVDIVDFDEDDISIISDNLR